LAGPVMGLCVPLLPGASQTAGFPLRIMTANMGDGAAWDQVSRVVSREEPDVIELQEVDQDWSETVLGTGWHWKHGAGTAIASRYPIVSMDQFTANGVD